MTNPLDDIRDALFDTSDMPEVVYMLYGPIGMIRITNGVADVVERDDDENVTYRPMTKDKAEVWSNFKNQLLRP